MALQMMYITNNPKIASIIEKHSVDRIWVDLEKIGKKERQANMNTVQSNHTIDDISRIRDVITIAKLQVRVNPIHDGSKAEIEEVIRRGADIVMLPYYNSVDEVKRFVEYVNGRARVLLLLETIPAEEQLDIYMQMVGGIDEVHIGLNDLHLQYHQKFMFELLADGKVDEICNRIKRYDIPFGFGGIAKLDEGLLPARHVIAEHYRIGSSMAILSRSFYDTWISNDYEEIERAFEYGLGEIRAYEKRLVDETPQFFDNNKKVVKEEVKTIVGRISGDINAN